MDERLGDLDALAHTLGVAAEPAFRLAGHAHKFERLAGAALGLVARKAGEPGQAFDKLPPGHLFIEVIGVWAVTHTALRRCLPGALPAHAHPSEIGAQLPRCQAHERRLARTVGADQARYAGPQLQSDLIDADHRSVPFRDVLEKQRRLSGSKPVVRSPGFLVPDRLRRVLDQGRRSAVHGFAYRTTSTARMRRFK